MISKYTKRFEELSDQIQAVEATKKQEYSEFLGRNQWTLNSELFLGWRVKARSLLALASGKESQHFESFIKAEDSQSFDTELGVLSRVRAVFLAAKEDYEGGYLVSMKHLVQSEVFGSELDQARELHASGYSAPAAVVAGVVLETTLRSICIQRGLEVGKLERMNADLVKAGQYTTLIQKRITSLAAVRNAAAHNASEFNATHVAPMIDDIERLVGDLLA